MQDVRQFGNRSRVVSLTPSVERDFGVDTPKGDDQAGFEEAAGVGGAGADPEVVERAHTPKGDDQAGFEEAAGVGGAGVDPEVFARALQDAQDAQRKLAGDELVKKQLRQSIGNRKGVVTRLITELNRNNHNRKFLQTIQPRIEESVEKLRQACNALLSIESLSTTEVEEINQGFLDYDWKANNARDMASNLLNFLDDQDNDESNNPKIPGTTPVKGGYIPDPVPPLPTIPPFKAPPLGPKPPPKKASNPQKMQNSSKPQHISVFDIKAQAAKEAGAFRDRLREVGHADRSGGQRQEPSPQQFSPYLGNSSHYPPVPHRPYPRQKAPSYRPGYFEQFGARPRQSDVVVPEGSVAPQRSHFEKDFPKGPNLQKSQGNPGSPRYQQTGSKPQGSQFSQGFQFGAGAPAGPGPQQDSHRFRADNANVPDSVHPGPRRHSNAGFEQQKGASLSYENDGFSDHFATPPPRDRPISGSQDREQRHQHSSYPGWEARHDQGHDSYNRFEARFEDKHGRRAPPPMANLHGQHDYQYRPPGVVGYNASFEQRPLIKLDKHVFDGTSKT